jgi:hypothetical protein
VLLGRCSIRGSGPVRVRAGGYASLGKDAAAFE